MSKLSWDLMLSFCRMNVSFELFSLCFSNINSTAVEFRIKSSWLLNSEYSDTGFNQAFALR